ncbi:MAG: MEDS domain-containing protein [Candidatus Bathyarchaeota archaeon]|nr:MEDS domain-containing protein [Candidatus Bathyarchaeota archaeon]
MLSLEENAEMLSSFGLTHNQAKVYIAIAQLGIASVSQVSKASKVRREDVYRILPKLEKMGLIEKILGTPTKIRAIPMEEALYVLIEREQEIANKRVSGLMSKKDEILKHYKRFSMETISEGTHFSLVSGREGIMSKELAMVKKAESAISIVTSRDKFTQFFNNYDQALKKATNRGIKVRMILNVTEHADPIVRIVKEYEYSRAPIDLKYTDQPVTHYMVVDFKEVLVATSVGPTIGENPYLWTDDDSLVVLLQKNFEGLWHASVELKNIKTEAVAEKLIHVLKDLRPTNHVIILYESPEAKYNVLFNYLRVGLENGEAAVYIASDENPSQIRDAMKRFDIEVEKNEKTGALRILGYNDHYIIEGKFNAAITMGLMKKMYDEALTKGFKGYRIAGEMGCFFKHNLVQELVDYERTLHRAFDLPIIGVCAYNSDMVIKASNPMDLYNELLKAHGTVLFSGLDKELGKIEIRKA